jgi:hypothetical protein
MITSCNVPAFQGIHKLPRLVQTFAHERCLLAHSYQGIFQETLLVLGLRGGCHGEGLCFVVLE